MRNLVLTFCCLCATVPAQEQGSPFRFVPKDSSVLLQLRGPGAWRRDFAKTQIAKLCAGPTLAPLFADAQKLIDAGLAEMAKKTGLDPQTLWTDALAYDGQVVFALRVDWSTLVKLIEEDEVPDLSFVVVVGSDGKRDLAGFAKAVGELAEKESGKELRDLEVAGTRLRVQRIEDRFHVSVPTLVGGHLVMLFGTDLKRQAPAMLDAQAGKTFEPGAEFDKRPFGLRMELETGLRALTALAADKSEEMGGPDLVPIVEKLGISCVRSFEMRVGAEGKHVAADTELALNDKPRGLLDVLGAPGKRELALLDLLPPGAETFWAAHLDLGVLYRTVTAVWDALEDQVPVSREDGEKQFAEFFKTRLKEDLLDHLGTEMMAVSDPTEAIAAAVQENDDTAASLSGTCLALALKDGKAFDAALDKMLRARGLHVGRKSEDYQGHKVQRVSLLGVSVEYAVTDDLLVLAFGNSKSAEKSLRAILDERAARKAGKPGEGLPAGTKAMLAELPPDYTSLEQSSFAAVLDGAISGLSIFAAQQDDEELQGHVNQVTEVMKKLGPELKQLGIDKYVSVTFIEAKRILSKLLW